MMYSEHCAIGSSHDCEPLFVFSGVSIVEGNADFATTFLRNVGIMDATKCMICNCTRWDFQNLQCGWSTKDVGMVS